MPVQDDAPPSVHPPGQLARRDLLATVPATERRVEAAGISTAVLEGGAGPSLVLLHGPGEFAAGWAPVLPELATTHHVVVPDLPGHGASDGHDRLDAERVLAWLGDLIDARCPAPPTLVGRTMGGAIAARFAIEHPDRVERLVLVDTLGLADFSPASRFELVLTRFLREPTERSYDRLMAECLYDLDTVRERMGDGWTPFARYAVDLARTESVQAATMALLGGFGLAAIPPGDLARIAVPTSLIWGRDDLATSLAVAQEASARYGWPLHVIDDAGDDPALEQPEAFCAALRSALSTSNDIKDDHSMTTLTKETTGVLDAVRAMAGIAARAEEIEEGRRLPLDLVDELVAAGCFRSLVPTSHGGLAASLPDHMRMIEELARADGSVGWTVTIGSSAPVFFGLLPPDTFDAVYADGPDVILAGAVNPTGRATPVDGGFRVTGRWAFASGCQHAHWIFAHCFVDDGRQPPLRMMLLPPGDVEIKDTWSVSGMRGTGSHDFAVNDVFVSDERSFAIFDESNQDGPLWRVPELLASSLCFGAVAVGIAAGAFDDVVALATGKVPLFSESTLAASPLFRNQLGEADARLRAARAAIHHEAEAAWSNAVDARPLIPEQRAHARAAATWAVKAAASVVDACYTAGGGSALYTSSPLQRRLRDAHVVTQHFAVKADTFTLAGAVLAGQEVDQTLL